VLDDLVRAGKVRYIGASNYPAWRLMEAVATSEKYGYARFETYQPEYSLLERQLFRVRGQAVLHTLQTGRHPLLAARWRLPDREVPQRRPEAGKRPRRRCARQVWQRSGMEPARRYG
jgi:aryl-alcohol dehydrogenase-like predicted oxidoreductase